MADIFPSDPTTDVGLVRSLIPDTNQLDYTASGADPSYIFSDAEIAAYLVLGRGSVLRASAFALEALGSQELYISKNITTEDLKTNGAASLNAFLNLAKQRHYLADKAEADAAEAFEIINFTPQPSGLAFGWY